MRSPSQMRFAWAFGPGLPARVVQILGVLGTSHALDLLVRCIPGHATSRLSSLIPPGFDLGDSGHGASLGFVARFLGDVLTNVVAPATLEELFFRGLLFEALRRPFGTGWAIFGSAALFGCAHFDFHQAVVAALLGLQLGALRAAFGLPLAIVAHGANNAAALLASTLAFEATWSGLALALLLAGSACSVLVQRLVGQGRVPVASCGDPGRLQRGSRLDE